MRMILNLHNAVFDTITTATNGWLLASLARFTFAATLLAFFWNSASRKIGDSFYSVSDSAYGQILPAKFWNEYGGDLDLLTFMDKLIVHAGTYAEFILPALIVIGLFTRLAAIGMIGFTAVLTYVDITGHQVDAATVGAWFDRIHDSQIMDQRLFWLMVLVTLVVKGAGPLSVDRLLRVK